jgi:hypothetical protein
MRPSGATPIAAGFDFKVKGLEQTASQLGAVTSQLNALQSALHSLSSQQGQLLQGLNGIFSGIQAGANNTAAALNGGGGGGGGRGPSIPMGFGGGGPSSSPWDEMTKTIGSDSSIVAMLIQALQSPMKFAYSRFEEARGNAPMVASALGPVATMNNTSISKLIQRLKEGTPVKGDLGSVLGALNQGALMGYGDLSSAKSGSYFEGIRQMQSFTPGAAVGDMVQMQNNWLSSTQSHQRGLMLTGGAMSGFGPGGAPKTLQEWSESTLKWFEGQRPGAQRGKKFTREELASQQFPGSNMDAWFTATGVPEYMRQYFWQYVIGAAQTGSTDFDTILGARGPDIAMTRLMTQTEQGRREFQMLGSGFNTLTGGLVGQTNYDVFNQREQMDRRFEQMLGMMDKVLATILGPLGNIISMIPTPIANLMATAQFSLLPNVGSSIGSFLFGGGGKLGDPGGKRRGSGKSTYIGDTYGQYGGTTTSHMHPSMAGRVEAMMEANPNLEIVSGFRDGALQGRLYDAGVGMVAPPGQSMHGRGLAADLGPESEFGWIVENAHRFGLESGIGHDEPWHVGMPGTVPMGDTTANRLRGGDEPIGDLWGSITGSVRDGWDAFTRTVRGTATAARLGTQTAASRVRSGTTRAAIDARREPGGNNPLGFTQNLVGAGVSAAGNAVRGAGEAVVDFATDAAGNLLDNIPGIGALIEMGKTFLNLFQGLKAAMSGDFSSLLGKGGLFDISNLMTKGIEGITNLAGLPIGKFLQGDAGGGMEDVVGWVGGSSGPRTTSLQSSVDWSSSGGFGGISPGAGEGGGGGGSSTGGGGGATYSGGPTGPVSVQTILRQMGVGNVRPTDVSGKEAAVVTALKAAASAGFKGNNLVIAGALAGAESGFNPRSHNPVGRDNSYGLWQINMLGSMGPARRREFGLSSNEELFDPMKNAKAAWGISSGGKNWKPWSTWTSPLKGGLGGAAKLVEPVYQIAKRNNLVGDPRRGDSGSTPALLRMSPVAKAAMSPAAAAAIEKPRDGGNAAVAKAIEFVRLPEKSGPPIQMSVASGPSQTNVSSSPVVINNTFSLQVSGNEADARRVAYMIGDHISSTLANSAYLGN